MPTPSRRAGYEGLSDGRLVAACLSGDEHAWEALVRRYERLVHSVARSYRLPAADQADVFQETFAALVRGLPNLRDSQALCRWIATTAERIAYAAALRIRRRPDTPLPGEDRSMDEYASTDEPVDLDLEALEEQTLVRRALGSLSERCRALLTALYYDDPRPPYAEIAARLGVAVGSLGPTRARCFDRMRGILAALRGPEEPRIRTARGATYPSGKEPRDGRGVHPPRRGQAKEAVR